MFEFTSLAWNFDEILLPRKCFLSFIPSFNMFQKCLVLLDKERWVYPPGLQCFVTVLKIGRELKENNGNSNDEPKTLTVLSITNTTNCPLLQYPTVPTSKRLQIQQFRLCPSIYFLPFSSNNIIYILDLPEHFWKKLISI